MSAESCFVPHRTERITHDTLSSGNATPTSPGMMGGYPGSVNAYKFRRGTDVKKRLERREMISDIAELGGRDEVLQLRQENFQQEPEDVYAVLWSAAGGYGDPFERDPERVREDVVENLAVSRDAAREIYGVVIGEQGTLDLETTRQLRAKQRARRLRKGAPPDVLAGKVAARASENLDLRRERGGLRYACAKCAADLGAVRDNYKDQCVVEERDIAAANPNIGDWRRYVDDRPVFRQFYCPGCGALIENEVARADDPVLRDIELKLK
jgi:N-methylhydantoinase B